MEKNKTPARILQCVSNMDRAGIETMLMNFYRTVDKNEIQFDFLCNKSKKGDYDLEIKKMGGNIYVSPGLNPLKWFKYQKYMKKLFFDHPEYKIIHCQNEMMGFPALYAAKKCGIPVRIAHSHNTTVRFDLKWPVKIVYKHLLKYVATDFVACGRDAGKYLFNQEVKIIHNAIDIKRFLYDEQKRNQIRKKMNLDWKFVIGHVGRFETQKNHKFIIRMFNEYQKKNDDAVLLLIGEGLFFEKIKKMIQKLNLSSKVIFTGNIPNVNELYNAMDLFILPSLYEGLPVVGIEAQVNGLPCLFSNKVTDEVILTKNSELVNLNIDEFINRIDFYKSNSIKRCDSVDYDSYIIENITKDLLNYYDSLIKKIAFKSEVGIV